MATEKNISTIDELMQELNKSHYTKDGQVYIETGMEEAAPSRFGFPMLYSFKPLITVSNGFDTYSCSIKSMAEESPNQELVRAYVKMKSLAAAAVIAKELEGICKNIKVNELPVEQFKEQILVYHAEFEKLQKAHEHYRYY